MPQTILRPAFIIAKKNLLGEGISRSVWKRNIGLLVFAAITMLLIFLGVVLLLRSMQGDAFFQAIIPVRVIQLTFYAFFILLLVSNTVAAVGNIYSAENMELLLHAPLSSGRLYLSKLLATTFETGSMYAVFILPMSLAYCYVLNIGASFLLTTILASIPFLLLISSISVVLATVFVNLASIVWKRGLLLFFAGLGAFIYFFSRFALLLADVRFEYGGTNAIVQLVGLFHNPNPLWLPPFWITELLTAYVDGAARPALTSVLLLVATAMGAISLGYLSFDFFVLSTRSRAQGHHRQGEDEWVKGASDQVRALIEKMYRRLPLDRHTRALIVKDLSCLVRDRAQSLQLILYLGIAAFYVVIFGFMSAAVNLFPIAQQLWLAFLGWLNIILSGFVLNAVITRLVYPAISLEGRAFWILLVAPLDIKLLVRAKFWCWLPLTASICLSMILAGGAAIGLNGGALLYSALVGTALSVGSTGLAVGLGSLFATFEWESPNQISSGIGTLVLLPLGLALVALTSLPAALLIILTQVPFTQTIIGGWATFGILAICLPIACLINWVAVKVACGKGIQHLERRTVGF